MMSPQVLARLVQIHRIFHRHGLIDYTRGSSLHRRLRWVNALSPWLWMEGSVRGPRGERLRLALQELGPVFVKFGQAISTRLDLLPPDIALELVKLQDQVPPFPGEVAQELIAEALGAPV